VVEIWKYQWIFRCFVHRCFSNVWMCFRLKQNFVLTEVISFAAVLFSAANEIIHHGPFKLSMNSTTYFSPFFQFSYRFSIHHRNSIQDNFQQQLQNLICIIQNLNILRHIFPQIIKLPVHSISIYSFKLSPHFSY
jgi:hypothetical protein